MDATSVCVTWQDNSSNETGFDIWVREAADASNRWIAGSVEADVTRFTVSEGLEDGGSYFLAYRERVRRRRMTRVSSTNSIRLSLSADLPTVSLVGNTTATSSCLAVSYRVENASADARWGLCWSAEGYTHDRRYGAVRPCDFGR